MRTLVSMLVLIVVIALFPFLGSRIVGGTFVEWLTAVGELAIAFVIFYEIEAERASRFMEDVKDKDFYEERADLYEAYANLALPAEATLEERAEAFRQELWKQPKLRKAQEHHWTSFTRLRFMMRYSANRRMLANWIPQVVVKFWIMTRAYILEHDNLSPAPGVKYGVLAVKESLDVLRRHGFKPIKIYSSKEGVSPVGITRADLEALVVDVDGLLENRWP
jgi:hypothetical protein